MSTGPPQSILRYQRTISTSHRPSTAPFTRPPLPLACPPSAGKHHGQPAARHRRPVDQVQPLGARGLSLCAAASPGPNPFLPALAGPAGSPASDRQLGGERASPWQLQAVCGGGWRRAAAGGSGSDGAAGRGGEPGADSGPHLWHPHRYMEAVGHGRGDRCWDA